MQGTRPWRKVRLQCSVRTRPTSDPCRKGHGQSSAWCATSTWPCTCPCATRTRRLTLLRDARDGQTVQVEGVVRDNRIEMRGRRQLIVKLDDGSGELLLRFLNFYGSQQKAGPQGALACVGELRHGFSGDGSPHRQGGSRRYPLAEALTPVYPTQRGRLLQAYLRRR